MTDKRRGPGRPPGDPRLVKITYATKLPRWLVEWLRRRDNAAVTIEDARTEAHDIRAPE